MDFVPIWLNPALLPLIYLRGLNPQGLYEIEGQPGIRSGTAWMDSGLSIPLKMTGARRGGSCVNTIK